MPYVSSTNCKTTSLFMSKGTPSEFGSILNAILGSNHYKVRFMCNIFRLNRLDNLTAVKDP